MNDLLNSVEVQEALGISRQTLYKWVANGKIATCDKRGIAGTLLFDPKEVEALRVQRIDELIEQFARLGLVVEIKEAGS